MNSLLDHTPKKKWCNATLLQLFRALIEVVIHFRQEDPSFVPRLEIFNSKEKAMSIDRAGDPLIVNPSSSFQLESGDKVNIVAGITIE